MPDNTLPTGQDEFTCLDAIRTARAAFLNDVVSHAHRHETKLHATEQSAKTINVTALRSENTFQVAEFYFLCEHFRLNDAERIAMFIERHNQDMTELLKNKDKARQQGLTPQRIQDAVFSKEQKAKVAENVVNTRLRLDQSDLGRFLAPVISAETCRKTLVALADGGLLERRNIGQVLVISSGILENYYRKHLRRIADAIKKGARQCA